MAEKLVTVEVDKDGNFSVDLSGFKGNGCKAVSDAFASVGKVVNETVKPEYYQEGPGGGGVHINSGH